MFVFQSLRQSVCLLLSVRLTVCLSVSLYSSVCVRRSVCLSFCVCSLMSSHSVGPGPASDEFHLLLFGLGHFSISEDTLSDAAVH